MDRFIFGTGTAARMQILSSAVDMFMQSPLFGSGWGRFPWLDFQYRAALAMPEPLGVTNNAHNLPVHLLAETGALGAAMLCAAVVLWARDVWKAAVSAESCWLVTLVVMIGMHSLIEFPLWHSYLLGVAAVAVGLIGARNVAFPVRRVMPLGFAAILAAGMANAAALAHEYRQFERLSATGQPHLVATLDALGSLAEREIILRPYIEFRIANCMDINDSFVVEKLALNERVMQFFPEAMVVFRHAVLLALAGDRARAEALFARAAHAYPHALPRVVDNLTALRAAYPAQIAPLLELASAKTPPDLPAP